MAASVMTKSKIGKSNMGAMKLFTAMDSSLDEKLKDFRKNSEWFAKNKEGLRKKYGGNYVAVHKNKICFADKDPTKLVKHVKTKYGDDPGVVVSFIGKEKVKFLL